MAFQAKTTVENTLDGENIANSIAQLPEKVMGHCLVALEGGDLFTTGGIHYDLVHRPMQIAVTGETHVFNENTWAWERLPDMPTPRTDHMCGLITTKTGSVLNRRIIQQQGNL